MEGIINPEFIELVWAGKIDNDGMLKARIEAKEYESFMRLAGIKRIEEIENPNLEIKGQISFIRKENNQSKKSF